MVFIVVIKYQLTSNNLPNEKSTLWYNLFGLKLYNLLNILEL